MEQLEESEIIGLIMTSLEGAEVAKIVSIAFFALFVYEWMITLADEIEYFWTGPWNLSRILFFINRYVPPFIMIYDLIVLLKPNPTAEFCRPSIQFLFIINIISLGVVQAMLILRVWHLFSSNKWIQYGMVICFIGSNIISLSYTIISAKNLELLLNTVYTLGTSGCKASRPKEFYRMFMPSLGLHTLLYVLTAIRALRDRHVFKHAPVLKRLLRDGGLFFFVVFATVGFTAVGSFLVQFPTINITIIYSNYLLSLTSIAMSRIMFSIHSLASNLGSSTNWLLSNVELSRVAWRQGRNKNEIIVERTYDDYDNCTTTGLGKGEEYEFPTLTLDISASAGRDLELAMERSRSKSPSTTIQMTRLTESRVGIYDDIRW